MKSAKPFRYALSANSTSGSFAAKNAGSSIPSGSIDLLAASIGTGGFVPDFVVLVPFGTAAADQTFDMRLYGYSETVPTDLVTDTTLYIPQLLVDLTCTLSAITFSDHAASTFLCDTLVVNDGAADNADWSSLISPAEDMVASIVVETRGCRYLVFEFDMTGATNANCLWRPLYSLN